MEPMWEQVRSIVLIFTLGVFMWVAWCVLLYIFICCRYCKALMYVVLWTTLAYHTYHWSTRPDLTSTHISSSNTLQEFKLPLIS